MTNTARLATKNLHRSLDRVRSYTRLPFDISDSTRTYVDTLLPVCADVDTGLFDLLLRSKDAILDNAIISSAVPADLYEPLQRLRLKHDELQLDKETALREQRYCDAKAILDRQRDLDSLIAKLVPNHIRVSPAILASAIRSLGYKGPLPNEGLSDGEP